MGRPCCCDDLINLVKLNAATGAKIWAVKVPGFGLTSVVNCGRVEALHGTNDVLVEVDDGAFCRIDSTGSQVWSYTGHNYHGGLARRSFGSDGTNIIASNITVLSSPGSIYGINYSGTNIWTNSFGSSTLTPTSIAVGAVGSVYETPARTTKINNSTGVTIWNNTANSGGNIMAIDSNDDSIGVGGISLVTKIASATGNTVATATFGANVARSGAAGYSFITGGLTAISGTAGTSLTRIFNTTTIGGATLASLQDTCNTTGQYFFAGAQQTGTGGVIFNIFCVDASGTLLWTQRYSSGTSGTDQVVGLCLSDDGFIYAAGGLSPK